MTPANVTFPGRALFSPGREHGASGETQLNGMARRRKFSKGTKSERSTKIYDEAYMFFRINESIRKDSHPVCHIIPKYDFG